MRRSSTFPRVSVPASRAVHPEHRLTSCAPRSERGSMPSPGPCGWGITALSRTRPSARTGAYGRRHRRHGCLISEDSRCIMGRPYPSSRFGHEQGDPRGVHLHFPLHLPMPGTVNGHRIHPQRQMQDHRRGAYIGAIDQDGRLGQSCVYLHRPPLDRRGGHRPCHHFGRTRDV